MSHICNIPKGNLQSFEIPCTGTGPINGTITSLKSDISEGFDDTKWMLFCQELSQYVTVESLIGVLYKRLEDVSLKNKNPFYLGYDSAYHLKELQHFKDTFGFSLSLTDFLRFYLHHGHLAINYQGNSFVCGMSYFDYIIDVSNAFIEYFNSHITDKALVSKGFGSYNNGILREVAVSGNKFYDLSAQAASPDVSRYQGMKVCEFKGQEIKLRIIENQELPTQKTTVISHDLAMFILNNILRIINYHYTNEYSRKQNNPNSRAINSEAASPTHQTVCYI
jgi:hypothetical protein